MQEQEDLRGVGVAFCEGEQVEVVVANVEILSSQRRNKSKQLVSLTALAVPCSKTYIDTLV